MLHRMEDGRDPSYTPFGKGPAPRRRDPADIIWTLRREGVDWTGELVFRGESYGWEARVLRSGDLVISSPHKKRRSILIVQKTLPNSKVGATLARISRTNSERFIARSGAVISTPVRLRTSPLTH